MSELLTALMVLAGALAAIFKLGDHKYAALWSGFVAVVAGFAKFCLWYHGVLKEQDAAEAAPPAPASIVQSPKPDDTEPPLWAKKMFADMDRQRAENNTAAGRLAFLEKIRESELAARFPKWCQLFTLTRPDSKLQAHLVNARNIVPAEGPGLPPLDSGATWAQGEASLTEHGLRIALPHIVIDDKFVPWQGSLMELMPTTGVSMSLDVNPDSGTWSGEGNIFRCNSPGLRYPLSRRPTWSIVIEVLGVTDEGLQAVLGVKPYDGPR